MSQATYACYADTVEESFVIETCPQEVEALNAILEYNGFDLDTLACCARYCDDIEGELSLTMDNEELIQAILETYDALCNAFRSKIGLELSIKYHCKEDRGDEVDGRFWEVEGVYILSPAGKKHEKSITRKFWTTWG